MRFSIFQKKTRVPPSSSVEKQRIAFLECFISNAKVTVEKPDVKVTTVAWFSPEKPKVDDLLTHPSTIQGYSSDIDTAPVEWPSGLYNCFHDLGNCCLTCWCPCVAVGQIAEVVDRGTISCGVASIIYYALMCVGCPCIYSCGYGTNCIFSLG